MKRRDILAGITLSAGASLTFPTPAISQSSKRLKMVTDWPVGPGPFTSAKRFANSVDETTAGRITIDVYAAGELVRPLDTFEAVQKGLADIFHSHIGYFEDKSPAFHFFSGLPFGLTPDELFAWVEFGGGQALWDSLGEEFRIKPLLCSSTGPQMGGWFVKEVEKAEDFNGLRYRMFGIGAEVYKRLGAAVVMVPASDIVEALQSGAIDACEWIGPWLDMELGLNRAARYYYYPGWHEPGTALALGIGTEVWASIGESDRRLIKAAAVQEYTVSLAQFNSLNAAALKRMELENEVQLRKFNSDLLRVFALHSEALVEQIAERDQLTKKIYESYYSFREQARGWSELSSCS